MISSCECCSGHGLGSTSSEESPTTIRPHHWRERRRQQLWRGVHSWASCPHAAPRTPHPHTQRTGLFQGLWLCVWPLLGVRVHRVISWPLPATDSGMRLRSDGWVSVLVQGERNLVVMRGRDSYSVLFLSVCLYAYVCVGDGMKDWPGWARVDGDKRSLISVSQICRLEISRSVTLSGF